MSYDDAVEAFGSQGVLGRSVEDVPVANIVGSAGRQDDFDAEFGLRNRRLRPRLERVRSELTAGEPMPPVDLIRLGELYFVVDGHHRVSVAKSVGRVDVSARVLHICTIAFAMCCIRAEHLASKAAERGFLERVPLDDAVRDDLWLDLPSDWPRLADAAESWAFGQMLHGRTLTSRRDAAQAWWTLEVTPIVQRLRSAGEHTSLRDIELYASALAARDRSGHSRWPENVPALLVP